MIESATGFILQPGTAQAHTALRSALEGMAGPSMYNSILVTITTAAKTRHEIILSFPSEQVNNHKRNDNSVFVFID